VAVQARADAQGVISKDNFKVFLLKAFLGWEWGG
jgi:hypothetical protein